MTIKNLILTVLSSLVMTACSSKAVYLEFQSVPVTGWGEDSVLTFAIPAPDTVNTYDIILHVRHTDGYKYQNMWLFTRNGNLSVDTIEFYLADDRGHWLSNGHSVMDMPILYQEHMRFHDSLHTVIVQHGMRSEFLKGVSDIGVEVLKN